MGAFQIWHIEFKDKESRKYFESLKLHSKILCVYDSLNEGFTLDVTYFMGWQGYAYGSDFLREHANKVNIKKFYSLDLSCRSGWYNELRIFKKEQKEV